jgi:spermidine synthase
MSWTSSTTTKQLSSKGPTPFSWGLQLVLMSVASGLLLVEGLFEFLNRFGRSAYTEGVIMAVWIFGGGLGMNLLRQRLRGSARNGLQVMGWLSVLVGGLCWVTPQMIQWLLSQIESDWAGPLVCLTWFGVLCTLMGMVLSGWHARLVRGQEGSLAWFLFLTTLAYALGQQVLLPWYGADVLGILLVAAWLLLGGMGLVLAARSRFEPLQSEPDRVSSNQQEALSPQKGAKPVTLWCLSLAVGCNLGVFLIISQWTLGESMLWHTLFLAMGVGALLLGFGMAANRSTLPAGILGWGGLWVLALSWLSLSCYDDFPFWAGWLQGQFSDLSEAWGAFVFLIASLGACLLLPPLVGLGYLIGAEQWNGRNENRYPWILKVAILASLSWLFIFLGGAQWVGTHRLAAIPVALCLALGIYEGMQRTRLKGLGSVAAGLAGILLFSLVSFRLGPHWARVFTQTDYLATGFFKTKSHTMQWAEQSVSIFQQETPEGSIQVRAYDYPEPNANLELIVDGEVVERSYAHQIKPLLNATIPCMLHGAPSRIAVIGMRAGMMAGYLNLVSEKASLHVIEPCLQMRQVAQYFSKANGEIMEQPNLTWHQESPLVFMQANQSNESFDLILSQQASPWALSQQDLFTLEFYQSCRQRLAPDGYMVQNLRLSHLGDQALQSVIATFGQVFPFLSVWNLGSQECMLIGSTEERLPDLAQLEAVFQKEPIQNVLGEYGLSVWPTILASQLVAAENGYHLIEDEAQLHTRNYPTLRWSAPSGRGMQQWPHTLRRHNELLNPSASTLLGVYLRDATLTEDQLRALSLLHLDHELLDDKVLRSLLRQWQAIDPDEEAIYLLLASTASAQDPRAVELERSLRWLEASQTESVEFIQQLALLMMEVHREERTLFEKNAPVELTSLLESLLQRDPEGQRLYRSWLAELAWEGGDLERFRDLAEQALNPDVSLYGPLNDSLDPSSQHRLMQYLAEDAWRLGKLEEAREVCAAIIQGDLLNHSTSAAQLRKTVRRILFALDRQQETQSTPMLEP